MKDVQELYAENEKFNNEFMSNLNEGDVITTNIFCAKVAKENGEVVLVDGYDLVHGIFMDVKVDCGTKVRYATPDELDKYHEALDKKNEVQ